MRTTAWMLFAVSLFGFQGAGRRAVAAPPKNPGLGTLRGSALRLDSVMQAVDKAAASRRGRYVGMLRMVAKPRKADKTLSPYFYIPGARPGLETLPLKSTSAEVNVAGVIAQVRVQQVYKNTGKIPIEAIYVFPGSTRAAVHGMRMKIGKRVVEATIKKRELARRIYNRARAAGRRASLLTQERANVFTMRVANIMPGDTIRVELDYSELLVPTAGTYSFIYPTVVGPRYGGGADPKTSRWIANPYLQSRGKGGSPVPYTFGMKLHLQSPIGLKMVSSPSHKVRVQYEGKTRANLKLVGRRGGNRDFVLNYRLAGGKIETGVMTYRAGGERFFLAMLEPPQRVRPQHIPRREYIFVLDISGSMYGFPLNTAKDLMRKLLAQLKPTDYFNIVLFAGTAAQVSPRSMPATGANLSKAIGLIGRQRGAGGTELLAALRRAYAIPKVAQQGVSRSVVVVTDGYVGVEAETFRFVRKNLHRGNCFAFGIGSGVNRALIEGLARAGFGEPFVVLSPKQAPATAARFQKYIAEPVLTDINLAFSGAEVYDVVPKRPPDLLAQRPLVVFGKVQGNRPVKLTITGHTGGGAFKSTLSIPTASNNPRTRPLRVLWARKWAETLMDQLAVLPGNRDIKAAVTNLGLGYNLLTRFTSFVAVDRVVANRRGKAVPVKQPLPLPRGVSNRSVGGTVKTGSLLGGRPHKRYKPAIVKKPPVGRRVAVRAPAPVGDPKPETISPGPMPRARPSPPHRRRTAVYYRRPDRDGDGTIDRDRRRRGYSGSKRAADAPASPGRVSAMKSRGCGCQSSGKSTPFWLLALPLLGWLMVRRRRRGCPCAKTVAVRKNESGDTPRAHTTRPHRRS